MTNVVIDVISDLHNYNIIDIVSRYDILILDINLNKGGDILYLYLPYKPNGPIEVKGLMNKVNRVWVVGNGSMLSYKVYNKNYWSEVPGNLYIDVPEHVLDPQITVIAVLLDGPVKLYRGAGQVIESN